MAKYNKQPNPNYIPPASVISMDNRRQYDYISKAELEQKLDSTKGMIGQWKGYPCQVVSLNPGDVLLVHISDDLDLDACRNVMKTLNETFPNNRCVLCNEHVLTGFTILRTGETQKVDDVVSIKTDINIDKLFEDIMRGNPNDFLY